MSFLGPHGSGKTTTLQKLYCTARENGKAAFYFDCARIGERKPPSLILQGNWKDRICFIDNAQKLRDETSIAEFAAGMSYCLAFSPVVSAEINGKFFARLSSANHSEILFHPIHYE